MKIDQLIRELKRELAPTIIADVEHIFKKYASKPAKTIPPVRKQPRVRKTVVRLRGVEMAELRRAVYVRDGLACVDCHRALTLDGMNAHSRMELSHLKSRGAGGSDTMENCVARCRECHQKSHNCGGKPVPKK